MKAQSIFIGVLLVAALLVVAFSATGGEVENAVAAPLTSGGYTIVDTGQTVCYNNQSEIGCPQEGQAFYGQDAQHGGNLSSYTLSADGLTVYDNVTGLTWTQSPDLDGDGEIDVNDKLTFSEALAYPETLNAQNFGGYSDWRLPTMKELYSLMDFRGTDPSGPGSPNPIPFIDTNYFAFGYGDESAGERNIDAQFWSSNAYVGTVFGNQPAAFGLNLADGRIKGYPSGSSGPITKLNYVYFVRGNTEYGINDFVNNGDGTITDNATGLIWSQDDSGDGVNTGPRSGMIWEDALAWVEQKNDENYLGHNDWRLPNAKEMQSLVDYSRAPDATGSAAIDPVFNITQITNEAGQADYPWFWTSTTHVRANGVGASGVYICFGRATGYVNSSWLDVHGAGAQRSDQKSGDFAGLTYTPDGYYFAPSPQGDATRSYNYVRLVRDADTVAPNLAPMAQAGGPYSGQPGSAIALSGAASADADGSIVLYEWDLDNDGQYDDATGVTAAFSSSSSGVFTVGLRVTDDDGAQGVDTAIVNVREPSTGSYRSTLPIVIKGGAGGSSGETEELTLFAPMNSTSTILMDSDGNVVQTWVSDYRPGNAVYLLENGNLLRTGNTRSESFDAGGAGGIVQEIALGGTVVWEFEYDSDQHRLHHDVEPLPNGNVLMIAWELKTESEAVAAGRNSSLLSDGELWPDTVIEVDHNGAIVWEWHVWDHLVQDYDPGQDNYGVVADHPELIDLNYSTGSRPGGADWTHINSIDYNADLDQILLSVRNFGEIWIIDHGTTTAQAAGPAGDLLYRWGNPQAFDGGSAGDQQLFVQHDAQWIPVGYPGEGNILVFNNGTGRPGGNYSSVDEIVPPVDVAGNYTSFGPAEPTWTYTAANPTDFYAERISGAQRLANGNTLICDGPNGHFFEITSAGGTVWEYSHDGNVFRVTRYPADYASLPDSTSSESPQPALAASSQQPAQGQPPAQNPAPNAERGQGPGGQQPPDLAAVAQKLGVSIQALRAALGEPAQGPPDLEAAAAQLGVTVEVLRDALGISPGGSPAGGRSGG